MEAVKMLVVFIFLFISFGKSDPALHRIAGSHRRPKPIGLASEAYQSCACFNTTFPHSLEDVIHKKPGLKRLVVFLYKDPKSGLQLYVPNKDIQPQFPELGWDNGELYNVEHETLNEVFDNSHSVFDMEKLPNYPRDHGNSINHKPSDGSYPYNVYTETHESYPNFETNSLSPDSDSSVSTPNPLDNFVIPNGFKPEFPKHKGLPVIEVPLLDLQSNPLQPSSNTDNGQTLESSTSGPLHFPINAKPNFPNFYKPQLNYPKTDTHNFFSTVKVPGDTEQPKIQPKPSTNDKNLSIQPHHESLEFSFDSKHNHPIFKDQDSFHTVNLPIGKLTSVTNDDNNPQQSSQHIDISVHTHHNINDELPHHNGKVKYPVVNIPLINLNSDKKSPPHSPDSLLWSTNTYQDSNDIPKHDYLIPEGNDVNVPVITVRPITNHPSSSGDKGDGSPSPSRVQEKPVPILCGVDCPQESGVLQGVDSFYDFQPDYTYPKNNLDRVLTLKPPREIVPGKVREFLVPDADGFDVNVYDYLKVPEITHTQDNHLIAENEYLTFDTWFAQQMQKIQNAGQSPKKNIDLSSIKNLLEKTLYENGLIVTKEGVLTDSKANALNMANVKLRPILIGDSVAYHNLFVENQSGKYELPLNLPYLESVLVTLVHPPRILGVIPLGKRFVPSTQLDRSKQYHSYYQTSSSKNQHSVKHKPIQISKKEGPLKKVKGRVHTKYYQNKNFNQRPQVIAPNYQYRLSWDKVLESLLGTPKSTERIGYPYKKNRKSNINGDELDNFVEENPEEYEPEEDLPGFRIIGGHPATSSGTPVSSKGRIGLKV